MKIKNEITDAIAEIKKILKIMSTEKQDEKVYDVIRQSICVALHERNPLNAGGGR